MKLLRYYDGDSVYPGVLDATGTLRALSSIVPDIDGAALTSGALDGVDVDALPIVQGEMRLAPCVGGVGKFLCIGLNYSDHAEEAGMPIPEHPILFLKANSAISGPHDDILLPRGSVATDWEVELGVVIGKTAKYVSEATALDHVAGYCVINDVSERDFQTKRTGQWTKGKSCDSFGPIGPWLVTKDEISDPQNLGLTCDVNGERMQTGSSDKMIFTIAQIIAHLSEMMTLHPGDVIATGTPPGVGMGMTPPKYLKPGDKVRLEIEGLGVQVQTVRADD